ncbi:DUF3473 domain-containing protein [Desulfatitalea alkaliphila]|uniref:DUF3473 domain-containing protein n=1 Tax=Desulfatitalea alkaliphila TaxID=2929485 RepID=A0AA41R4E0_9BACT|nr:DUF3473 domain-containing protein [Desulfatitalea alkaliphila]MCJ8502119.1 DUF3473 domain-containing protein [Desulfatitalea alkaliphila]
MHQKSAAKPTTQSPPTILLTIDVEDWFQVENLRPWFPPDHWHEHPLRVETNTHCLLDLFDSFKKPIRATFFILGWIAQRCPQLVQAIHNRGHEVASHGNSHLLCNQMAPADLLEDLCTSKQRLEALTGQPVYGYRAPNFSIDDNVLQMIHQCGYRYDASYNSFAMNHRYGRISNNHKQTGMALQLGEQFHELPISNLQLAGKTIPWGGGGYFRLLPPPLFNAGVRHILQKTGVYHFYIHPWELDPDQPKVQTKPTLNTWRHYLNLHQTQTRLHHLITRFKHCRFQTCTQYIETITTTTTTTNNNQQQPTHNQQPTTHNTVGWIKRSGSTNTP